MKLLSSVGYGSQTRNPDTATTQCHAVLRSSKESHSMDKIPMLKEILAQNPSDAFARYGLAMEHANQGNTTSALEEFQQLTTAHPDYTAGYQMAAQLLIKAGRDGEARERLEAGVAAARRTGNALALNEMSAMLDELSG
jgi:predicted Zn-dependent protease